MVVAAALALLFRDSIALSDMAWIRQAQGWAGTLGRDTAV